MLENIGGYVLLALLAVGYIGTCWQLGKTHQPPAESEKKDV